MVGPSQDRPDVWRLLGQNQGFRKDWSLEGAQVGMGCEALAVTVVLVPARAASPCRSITKCSTHVL